MRTTFIVLLLSSANLLAITTLGQNTRINLKVHNASFQEAVAVLQKESDYYLFYRSEDIPKDMTVSANLKNVEISEVMDVLLSNTSLSYKIVDKYIAVLKKSVAEKILLSQQDKVTGTVKDDKGNTLPGVSVVVKGTTIGTITNTSGYYLLTNVPVNAILQFSFIGMKSQEIAVGDKTSIDVIMQNEAIVMDQVVVVAFGTQQKRTMTSSVSVVDSKMLENRPVNNISSALQGQAAGVNITQSSGQPGAGANITIRGVGSLMSGTAPLIIIDGIAGGSLSMVNPNDVESISVLKDAAACSMYGARASNGVILVTTKHGKLGKLSVSYNAYVGFQTPTELFQEADAYNYANSFNTALMYDKITRANPDFDPQWKVYPQAQLDDWKSGKVPSTNWRSALFDQKGFTQSHTVNIAGGIVQGNLSMKNNISIGYLQQDGNVANTNYKRYTVRENGELKVGKFTTGLSIALGYTDSKEPTSIIGGLSSIISAVNRQRPVDPIKNADGDWTIFGTKDTRNPVRQALEGGLSKTNRYNVLANLNFAYNILPGLSVKLTNGLNYTESSNSSFINTLTWYSGDPTGPNSSTKTTSTFIHYLQQLDLNYQKSFGKHNFAAIVGGQQEYETYSDLTGSRMNYINNASGSLQLGSLDGLSNWSSQYDWAIMGVFGRFNYDYDKRYMLEVNFREDGSSRLSAGKNWDFFPSVSAGWRISEEKFFASLKPVVSDLKLRGSYGILGNTNVPGTTNNEWYYSYQSIVSGANDNNSFMPYWGPLYYVFGSTLMNPMTVVQDQNTSYTWERTKMQDIALEGNLWNGLLTFSVGHFIKTTEGMLINKYVSSVHGGNLPFYKANIGKLRNSGLEFELGVNKSFDNGIVISANGNLTHMTQKILNLGDVSKLPPDGIYRNQVGYPLYAYYMYQNDGLLTKAEFLDPTYKLLPGQKYGDQKIKDVSGPDGTPDGVINAYDKVISDKTSTPKWLYGFNFDVSYHGIGIAGMIQGAADYYKYLGASVGFGFNSGYSITNWTINNSYDPLVDENNYNTRLPRVSVRNSINNTMQSDMYLFKCSYVRLKNLQVYYNLPKELTTKLSISNAKVYFSGQNLFTLSALPKDLGIDPEIGSATGGYPLVKIFTLGMDITF